MMTEIYKTIYMKTFSLLFLLIFSTLSFGQNSEQQTVLNDVSEMIMATENQKFEAVIDYMHPAIFELVDKNTMKASLQQMSKGNEEFKMEIIPVQKNSLKVSSVRESKSTEGRRYAFIHYPFQFKMISQKEEFYDILGNLTERALNIRLQFNRQRLYPEFVDNYTLLIKTTSMMIGIKDNETQDSWKYINFDPNHEFLAEIFSEELFNDAKNYYYDILSLEKQ